MTSNLSRELATLQQMSVGELQTKYFEVFGETTNGRHRIWLQKRIAWRIQANAFGGLTDRARERAAVLANEADLRVTAPPAQSQATTPTTNVKSDRRLRRTDERIPPVGDYITRIYKGREHVVTVRHNGFEHDGQTYKTLTAVAKHISGQHCSGFRFFNLTQDEAAQ